MTALQRLTLIFPLVLASTGFAFAQTSDNDIPEKLRTLAAELGCKTKVECRKIFDANFEKGIQLAEQHRVYNAAQQRLATTFKESVLQKLSAVPDDQLERAIIDVAQSIIEKNRDLAKQLKLNRDDVRAAKDVVDARQESQDGPVRLARELAAGKYPELGKNPDDAGAICLRPGSPAICDKIAEEYFGSDGVAELGRARSNVRSVADTYKKDGEKLELRLSDGQVFSGRDEIRRRCDRAFQERDAVAAEACGRFAVAHGFAREGDVRRGLEFLRGVSGPGVDFRRCDVDPSACAQYLPETQRREFAVMRQFEDVMRKHIGFDPRECSRGDSNPDVGQRCFEGSKKAIAEIDALNLAAQSPEVARIVGEIKGRIREGEAYDRAHDAAQQAVRQQGGPGGCTTDAACATYCSLPEHGAECIAFGARVGVFRSNETNTRLQRYEEQYQRVVREPSRALPASDAPPIGPSPECFQAIQEGDFVKAKEICRVPSAPPAPQVVPKIGLFNDVIVPPPAVRLPCPTVAIHPDTCAGQPGTTPEMDEQCRLVCRPSPSTPPREVPPAPPAPPAPPQCDFPRQYLKIATNTCEPRTRCSTPDDPEYASQECRGLRNEAGTIPPPIGDSCASYGYGWHRMEAENGNCYGPEMRQFRVRSGVLYECGKQPAEILAPGCAPIPSPTQCVQGQYWNGASCVATGTSANACDINLKNILGDGCHYMYNNDSGSPVFCNGAMTMSAKRGDIATTPGCTPPSGGGTTPPTGQREQVWNILLLRSWIRSDADAARIEQLKQSCANTRPTNNVWMPGAGDATSANFGMPDPAKCQLANACASGEYFDGSRCAVAGGGGAQQCPTGQWWNGTACVLAGPPVPVPQIGQRQQIWNALGLQSWVRADADTARIDRLKQSCVAVATGANIWLSGAGDPTSVDFGMPDPAKCALAGACITGQYFNGTACVSAGPSAQQCPTGQWWNGTACIAGGVVPPGGSSCSAALIALLGEGCHPMGGGTYFNAGMTRWVLPPATVASECATSSVAGCTVGGAGNQGQACPAGQYWNGGACTAIVYPAPGAGSCPADIAATLGNGCHNMGAAWFDASMARYVLPNTTAVKECTTNYLTGCTVGAPHARTYAPTPLAHVLHVLGQFLR